MGLMNVLTRIFTNGAKNGKDKTLACIQCRRHFMFESGEQEFYKERGLQEPKRCPRCRKQARTRRR